MQYLYWILAVLGVVLLMVLIWLGPRIHSHFQGLRKERLAELFQSQKAGLKEEFLRIGQTSGKPRGLHWKQCDWGEASFLARDRSCNGYIALMEVAIQFAAIEGSDMEDVEAVALAKDATAIFFFETGKWHTGGKAVFNLNPEEVMNRFRAQYERL